MKKHSNSKTGFIHLYDPDKEGLGSYDIHYINAYKKNKNSSIKPMTKDIRRDAA